MAGILMSWPSLACDILLPSHSVILPKHLLLPLHQQATRCRCIVADEDSAGSTTLTNDFFSEIPPA
jgi:hypothetical protein